MTLVALGDNGVPRLAPETEDRELFEVVIDRDNWAREQRCSAKARPCNLQYQGSTHLLRLEESF
jgi:hypothetical protein